MDIHQLFTQLEAPPVKKKKVQPKAAAPTPPEEATTNPTPAPVSSREAKTLEYQLNTHLRLKYKKPTRVTFHNSDTTTPEDISTFLAEQEAQKPSARTKKSWNSLAIHEKWKLLQAAVTDPTQLQLYQTHLRQGTLQAAYDPAEHTISNISVST